MFHIGICEDMPEERKEIRRVLGEVLEECDVAAEFAEYASGDEMLEAWNREKPNMHLLFLDIYMKGSDGVETARRLRAAGCKATIIFLTMTSDFAIEGYEVEAAGYLLKPLEREKLRLLLKRLLSREKLSALTLRQGSSVFTILPSEIVFIESRRNRLLIHTVEETIAYYGRLDELAGQLPSGPFLRCHQSFLVNMNRIRAAEEDFQMETGAIVPIRVRERRAIREEYFRFITEKNA